MKRLLFVDDEGFFARPYITELEREFVVDFTDRADDAVKRIKSATVYNLVILDIMMPTPSGIASTATGNGLSTGIWILREVAGIVQQRSLPVLILTNRGKALVTEELEGLMIPPELIQVFAKPELPSRLLPVRVQTMIDSMSNRTDFSG